MRWHAEAALPGAYIDMPASVEAALSSISNMLVSSSALDGRVEMLTRRRLRNWVAMTRSASTAATRSSSFMEWRP